MMQAIYGILSESSPHLKLRIHLWGFYYLSWLLACSLGGAKNRNYCEY